MKNKEKSISSKIEIAGLPSSYGFMKVTGYCTKTVR